MSTSHVGGRTLVAFLGPSLPAAEARRLLPEVELWPPICQGDLATALERSKPAAILIVDGEFSQNLSVWHKEILHAIHLGVRVIGASSMGALRAAELDRFGMEGVGEIYAYYRDGWLTEDADVAVLHADAEDGYRPLTWPLVNVRATVNELERRGKVTRDDAEAILAVAGELHFMQRNRQSVARALEGRVASGEHGAGLAQLLADEYVDQKARDAIAGFQLLANLELHPAPAGETPLYLTGRGLLPMLASDVEVKRPAASLRRYQLVADVALHHPDYDGLMARAADRYLVRMLGHEIGVEASDSEIAEQRAATLTRLALTEESLGEWLDDNDLDESRFEDLIEQEAVNTRLRRWLLTTRLFERNRRLVIEQLQLEGQYVAAADGAARRRAMADSRPAPTYPTTDQEIRELVIRQMAISGWKPRGSIVEFADDQGFDSFASLLVALSDSAAANIELQERRQRVAKALGVDGSSPGTQDRPPAARPSPAARMHALLEAHQVTQILLTALELGIPEALADGPRTGTELATATRTQVDRLERLLDALTATGIVNRAENGWALTEEGRALVFAEAGDGPSLALYGRHIRSAMFSHWADLPDIIRGGNPRRYPADELSDLAIAATWRAFGLEDIVIDAVELPPGARVADIGGGLGELTRALSQTRTDLVLSLVELPETAGRAAPRFTPSVDGSEVDVVAYEGQQQLERAVDRCLFTRVISTLDDARAADMLAFARRSLRDGGRIEVIDFDADAGPPAQFADLINLARSGGAVRSRPQWDELAGQAGLSIVARRRLTVPFALLSMEPI